MKKILKNFLYWCWGVLVISQFIAGLVCIIMSAFKPNTMTYLGRAIAFFVVYEIFLWWSKGAIEAYRKKKKEKEAEEIGFGWDKIGAIIKRHGIKVDESYVIKEKDFDMIAHDLTCFYMRRTSPCKKA